MQPFKDGMCLNIGETHDKMSCKNLVKDACLKDEQQEKMKERVYVIYIYMSYIPIQCYWEITKKKPMKNPWSMLALDHRTSNWEEVSVFLFWICFEQKLLTYTD